jgi:biotin carboxylase
VQVGKTDEGPLLLEINPRFSSLAAARGVSGFTDVEWSIKIALGLEIILPGDYKHIRFRRFFHELIDLGEGFQALADWSPRQCTRPTSKANTR